VILAPSREAGRAALSRVVLEDIRLAIRALVPEDRARLAEELRDPRVDRSLIAAPS
jgi:hypothetical protein